MRTPTAVWAVSLALLSSPLSIIAEAAPAPYPIRHGHQRRYLVPVRRQNTPSSFNNLSGPDPFSISSDSSSIVTTTIPDPTSSITVPTTSAQAQAVDPEMPPFISSQTLSVVSSATD